jgi:hypothetical protein
MGVHVTAYLVPDLSIIVCGHLLGIRKSLRFEGENGDHVTYQLRVFMGLKEACDLRRSISTLWDTFASQVTKCRECSSCLGCCLIEQHIDGSF